MDSFGNKDTIGQAWQDVHHLRNFNEVALLKVVDGPAKVRTQFYKTYDAGTGKIQTKGLIVDDKNSFFSALSKLEYDIIVQEFIKKGLNSRDADLEARKVPRDFKLNYTYHCLCLKRSESDVPVLQHWRFPYTVWNEMTNIEKEPHFDITTGAEDKTRLKYGLLFMLWLKMKKIYKKEEMIGKWKDWRNTDYHVEVESRLMPHDEGSIRSALLGSYCNIKDDEICFVKKRQEISKYFNPVDFGYYTKEEWDAVLNYESCVHDIVKPLPYEEALDKLKAHPIALDAKYSSGVPVYKYHAQIMDYIEKNHFDLPLITGIVESGEPSELSTIEEVDVVEVEAEDFIPPAKKRQSLDDILGDNKDIPV